MGLFTKKTAAEKKRKQDQKEAKKVLKDEKKDIKKDARKEKKDIRKDARADKKDIRKSDATGKEKREAKKDVRKDKRSDVKGINKEKKKDVKEVKKEIKKVKRWLDIQLPSVPGNIAILRADLREITYSENGIEKELVLEDAFDMFEDAYAMSKEISARGLRRLQTIIDEPRDEWTNIWADRVRLVKWFGKVDKPSDVKDVYDRLKSVDDRLNKQITLRFHPQRDEDTNAQNMGTFFEPKTFKVFPNLIKHSLDANTNEVGYDYIASVLVHELIHVWFTDQKLDGKTVYGDDLALELALENPKKARRSAENYELFCMSFA